jgi:hypothetical protein
MSSALEYERIGSDFLAPAFGLGLCISHNSKASSLRLIVECAGPVLAGKRIRVSSSCPSGPRVWMLEPAEHWRGVHSARRETGYHRWIEDALGYALV